MNRLQRIATLASSLVFTLGIGLGTAHAVTIPACWAGAGCDIESILDEALPIGDALITFTYTGSRGIDPDFSSLILTPLDDGGLEPGPGVHFGWLSADLPMLTSVGTAGYSIDYSVEAPAGEFIKDLGVRITGFDFFGTGEADVTNDDVAVACANLGGVDCVRGPHTGTDPVSVDLGAPVATYAGTIYVDLQNHAVGDTSRIDSWDVRFSQSTPTPEPSASLVFATGFTVFALANRKRRAA